MAFLGVGFGHRPYGSFRSESFAFVIPFNISYVGVIDSTFGSSGMKLWPNYGLGGGSAGTGRGCKRKAAVVLVLLAKEMWLAYR